MEQSKFLMFWYRIWVKNLSENRYISNLIDIERLSRKTKFFYTTKKAPGEEFLLNGTES